MNLFLGERARPGRRRRDWRRAGLRTLLLAATALATSHSVKTQTKPLKPSVSVAMNDFRAVNPDRAYDDLIAEAAEEYGLDPELIVDAKGENIPFPDNSFDVVFSSTVLEHTDDPDPSTRNERVGELPAILPGAR